MNKNAKKSGKKPVGRPKRNLSEKPVKKLQEKPAGQAKPVKAEKKPAMKTEEKSGKRSMLNSGYMNCWETVVENYAEVIKRAAQERELIAKIQKGIDKDVNKLSGFLQTKDGQALMNEFVECVNILFRHSNIMTVFSAMTLEAYIDYYAATKLQSKAYFDNYIAQLKLLPKWVLVPQLAVQKSMGRKSHGFTYMRNLLSYRSDIVYENPVDADSESYLKKVLSKIAPNPETRARTAVEAVKEMVKELKKIDPDIDTDWIKRIEQKYLAPF